MNITVEQPGQETAIRTVVEDAFGRVDEADLVDALRSAGDLAVSLVAERDGVIIGHVGLSRMRSPVRALALAPLSVAKAEQHRGVASALVRGAIAIARERGDQVILVVGDPSFYKRFGFTLDAAAGYTCRYAGPYLMALQLVAGAVTTGTVTYADALERWKELLPPSSR